MSGPLQGGFLSPVVYFHFCMVFVFFLPSRQTSAPVLYLWSEWANAFHSEQRQWWFFFLGMIVNVDPSIDNVTLLTSFKETSCCLCHPTTTGHL